MKIINNEFIIENLLVDDSAAYVFHIQIQKKIQKISKTFIKLEKYKSTPSHKKKTKKKKEIKISKK